MFVRRILYHILKATTLQRKSSYRAIARKGVGGLCDGPECSRAKGVGLAEGEARAAKRPQGSAPAYRLPSTGPFPSFAVSRFEIGLRIFDLQFFQLMFQQLEL